MKQRIQRLPRPGYGRMPAVAIGLVILVLVAAGCAPATTAPGAAAPAQPTTAAPAAAATTAPAAASEMPAATMAPAATAMTPAGSASASAMPATTMAPAATAGTAAAPAASAGNMTGTPTGPALVNVAKNDKLGQFLADARGMSLYLYTKDTKDTSNCYDKCAVAWPPLYTNGAPQAGDGVTASLLGTTQRKDGTMQVTYNGYPLYYYVKDQQPGDVTGQDVGKVWYVISPAGEEITTPMAQPTAAAGAAGATPAATTASAGAAAATPAATEAAAGKAAGGGQTVNVTIKDFKFGDAPLTVAAGTTVVWTNTDGAPHTVTADDGSFDSGNLNTGDKFQFTFKTPGTYAYYCTYHGGKGGTGMASKVIVQ